MFPGIALDLQGTQYQNYEVNRTQRKLNLTGEKNACLCTWCKQAHTVSPHFIVCKVAKMATQNVQKHIKATTPQSRDKAVVMVKNNHSCMFQRQ